MGFPDDMTVEDTREPPEPRTYQLPEDEIPGEDEAYERWWERKEGIW